jgi:hypothetical protein
MVAELDAKGLHYTYTAWSENNAKSMQQPNDDGLGFGPYGPRSGLGHFFIY